MDGGGLMAECRAEYERKGGRQSGDRIVRCCLPDDHYPYICHEEADTGVRWWDIPPSLQLRRRTPDEQLAYWSGKSVEWIAEKAALTARAERAEAAEVGFRRQVDAVRALHRPVPYGQPMMTIDRVEHLDYCAECGYGVPHGKCRTLAALVGGQPDTPAPAAEPAIDMALKRPCTIYVPPEDCSDPSRCRVHRGAYPRPATGETP